MKTPRRPRGFSLVELLMTVAVSSLVIAGMASAFISQARQYQLHANRRAIQSHGRQGLLFMEAALRRAGYGVDPWLAITPFDAFDRATNAQLANYPDGVTVLSRDPLWRRSVVAATATQLQFTPALTEPLKQGQILLVLGCGAQTYAYVTVGRTADAGDTQVDLSVTPAATETPVTMPGARFHQQGTLTNECLNNPRAVIAKVDRSSFYVDAFPEREGDARASWTPYLMWHKGIDENDDEAIDYLDAVPLVDNVEQLQLAYVLNTSGNTAPVVMGVDPAMTTWAWGTAWDSAAGRPSTKEPYHSSARLTSHPANIRQVRATVVTRGVIADPSLVAGNSLFTPSESYASGNFPSGGGGLAWRQLENLNGALPAPFDPSSAGYIRQAIRMSVTPKNLLMRSQFNPPTLGGG